MQKLADISVFEGLQATQNVAFGLSSMSVFNLGIDYANPEIREICTAYDEKAQANLIDKGNLARGLAIAKQINARVSELQAADTLAELITYQGDAYHHPMQDGNRAKRGEVACRISPDAKTGRERLMYVAATPPPQLPNGQPDYRKVKDVVIEKIDDPHRDY